MWDLSCETVREQLTNSIRRQWRILKSHVEKLDNQVSKVHLECANDEDVISRQDHEQETEKLELEIQQCKEMIKTQQQLLQVSARAVQGHPPRVESFIFWGCGAGPSHRSCPSLPRAAGLCQGKEVAGSPSLGSCSDLLVSGPSFCPSERCGVSWNSPCFIR